MTLLIVSGCSADRIRMGCYPPTPMMAWVVESLREAIQNHKTPSLQRIELLAGLAVTLLLEEHAINQPNDVAVLARLAIDSEFHAQFSLPKLAARLHVSSDHLRERFRLAVGEPPSRYLLSRRIAAAQELLRTCELPVQEVARMCGFRDPLYFSRQFHRLVGCSPTLWRQQGP